MNKTNQQLHKVFTPCIDDNNFKEEETKSVEKLSNACSQIVLKCLYLARIGLPDILRSVKMVSRSITKWTKAFDKRLNRLIFTYSSYLNTDKIVACRPVYVRLALWFFYHHALDGGKHGWVPVDTHRTPVLISVRRLWVAHVLHEPNEPKEHAQPAHGSEARVQDHDPETSQLETQTPRQSAAPQSH